MGKKNLFQVILFLLLIAFYFIFQGTSAIPIKMEKITASKLPEEMILARLFALAIDSKGNVFTIAVAGKDRCIIKFSPSLDYITHFSRAGLGPSEISSPGTLSTDASDNVHISCSNPERIIVFDNNGKYLYDIPIYKYGFNPVRDAFVIGNKKYASLFYNIETQKSEGILLSIDPPKVRSLYTFTENQIIVDGGASMVGRYYGEKEIIDTDSKHILFGEAQSFKFHVFDTEGRLILKVIDKKRKSDSFSSEEMQEIKKIMSKTPAMQEDYRRYHSKIEDSKHVITNIKLDADRVYVFTVEDIRETTHFPVEIYDLKGHLVKKGTMPFRPDKIWKNYAFYFDRDAEDNPVIIKYKILD